MSNPPDWSTFQSQFLRYNEPDLSLDYSRMGAGDDFFLEMHPFTERAIADMIDLEDGGIANPDEGRMVGHYWLRNPELAPGDLSQVIRDDIAAVKSFAREILDGQILTPDGAAFEHILLVGIGGSALGPQLVADALGAEAQLDISFLDNTDPVGIARALDDLGGGLATTLVIVTSKSGGTPETRNGMLEVEAAFTARGHDFAKQAVAVTGVGSKLDRHAEEGGWLRRFRMHDWVGGRTSVMSTVGLLPAALQGVDVDAFLEGAALMDQQTRNPEAKHNAAMLLALMWHHAGGGRGARDMVVLPYKDSLALFAKYLQQLVMESLGKELDLDGKPVHQGIAVYGNKGSTDQHAYIQQLRDGLDNFFATFIEVRESGGGGDPIDVEGVKVFAAEALWEKGITSGDYLQGFLRGTRRALTSAGRPSITISIPRVDAGSLGSLIALFERAVSFYASFVNINAYHQPGVEAGKQAAGEFLEDLVKVRAQMAANTGRALGPEEVASAAGLGDPEHAFHLLNHLAANDPGVTAARAATPSGDTFTLTEA